MSKKTRFFSEKNLHQCDRLPRSFFTHPQKEFLPIFLGEKILRSSSDIRRTTQGSAERERLKSIAAGHVHEYDLSLADSDLCAVVNETITFLSCSSGLLPRNP